MAEKPAVTKRLDITSIDQFIDDRMYSIGKGNLSLSTDEDRDKLRRFMGGMCRDLVRTLHWDFAKGAAAGIKQIQDLVLDPDYYENRKARRKVSAEREKKRTDDDRIAQWAARKPLGGLQ